MDEIKKEIVVLKDRLWTAINIYLAKRDSFSVNMASRNVALLESLLESDLAKDRTEEWKAVKESMFIFDDVKCKAIQEYLR